MELIENEKITKPDREKIQKPKSVVKKIDQAAGKLLSQLKEKVNKKERGRKIRESQILALGLKLIRDEHILELQQQSFSERDRLMEAHAKYQKSHGKLSLDEFIGKLLKGEISQKPPSA